MEEIFYVVLALYIAHKPISKENIKAVFKAAGTPVNEAALDVIAAFVEFLEAARQKKERAIDPRIIKFLASELAQQKMHTKELEALLQELAKLISSAPRAHEAILKEAKTPAVKEEMPAVSEKAYRQETVKEDTGAAVEVSVEESGITAQAKGRYLYGIAAGTETARLGSIGIDGSEVYTISYKELCAIVHNCSLEPYQSNDDKTVKNWARAHQNVLDAAKERFDTVIPLGFDTILQPKDDSTSPDQVVKNWLKEDYDRLLTVMERIKDRNEYGVQIFYDPKVMGEIIVEKSEEVRKLKEEMATKSPGLAYMYKQKLEKAAKAEMERLAEDWFRDFYKRIKKYTDDIMVEKTKKIDKDKVMLINLSCLVAKEKVESLGKELEEINNMEGFSVRFTGPWPPYSFVSEPIEVASTTEESTINKQGSKEVNKK